jgi:uncharacterized protein YbaP (TraB family)
VSSPDSGVHSPNRKAAPLFETIEEQLEYMEDADLDAERATLLESLGRWSEAADVHFAEGLCVLLCTFTLRRG